MTLCRRAVIERRFDVFPLRSVSSEDSEYILANLRPVVICHWRLCLVLDPPESQTEFASSFSCQGTEQFLNKSYSCARLTTNAFYALHSHAHM